MINLVSNLKKTLLLEHEMSCLCCCFHLSPSPQKSHRIFAFGYGGVQNDAVIKNAQRLRS